MSGISANISFEVFRRTARRAAGSPCSSELLSSSGVALTSGNAGRDFDAAGDRGRDFENMAVTSPSFGALDEGDFEMRAAARLPWLSGTTAARWCWALSYVRSALLLFMWKCFR